MNDFFKHVHKMGEPKSNMPLQYSLTSNSFYDNDFSQSFEVQVTPILNEIETK